MRTGLTYDSAKDFIPVGRIVRAPFVLVVARGDFERAGLLWGAVSVHDERLLGMHATPSADALRQETRPTFVSACERGRKLDVWDAAAIALGEATDQTVP